MMHRVKVVADITDMRHRADQAEMISQLSHLGVQFVNLHARDGRGDGLVRSPNRIGSTRFQVPCI